MKNNIIDTVSILEDIYGKSHDEEEKKAIESILFTMSFMKNYNRRRFKYIGGDFGILAAINMNVDIDAKVMKKIVKKVEKSIMDKIAPRKVEFGKTQLYGYWLDEFNRRKSYEK